MPELPEVETIRRDLEKSLAGDKAISLKVFDRRLMSTQDELRWGQMMLGQVWRSFNRKGKYLWINLSNEWHLAFHLRMTGQLILDSLASSDGKDLHQSHGKARMQIGFASGKTLRFCDQRRFGEAWLLSPDDARHAR